MRISDWSSDVCSSDLNERELGVKNGSLGTVEKAASDRLEVRLDNGRRVAVDLKSYADIDHGYAATVHKTQGMTVDRTHILATPGLNDRKRVVQGMRVSVR